MTIAFPIPDFDFTSRDYSAIRDDMIDRIQYFTEEWTDHSPNDPGIVILQLLAGGLDVLHFYLDQKQRETYIPTVKGRRSAGHLGALIGQRIKGKAPSAVDCDFTLQTAQVNPTPLPIGTLVSSVGLTPPVFFETLEAVSIPAGALTVTGVNAIAGQSQSATLATSDGTRWQEYRLNTPEYVLDDGIAISVDGTEWDYIEALGQAGPDDQVWSWRRDELGEVYIQFGNGDTGGGNGKIPPASDVIDAVWREGGGRNTNVGVGVVKTVLSTIMSGGSPVSISCNNPKAAQGGDEEETVKSARRRMPRAYKANDRGVVANDFEALAEGVPGVLLSQALVTGVSRWTLYILPHPSVGVGAGTDPFGYAVLTTKEQSEAALAQVVYDRLVGKVMGTDFLDVKVVRYRPIDTTSVIHLLAGANRSQVELEFSQLVADFFDIREREIGVTGRETGNVNPSDWVAEIEAIKGVDYVDSSIFQLRPQVEPVQAIGEPVFSTIAYTPFTTHAVWDVLFISGLAYQVFRSEVGGDEKVPQSTIGALGAVFTDDNNELELVVEAVGGQPAPLSGDRFRFRSSPRRESVRILEGEVAVQGAINVQFVGGEQ